jgi:hypothetical protein
LLHARASGTYIPVPKDMLAIAEATGGSNIEACREEHPNLLKIRTISWKPPQVGKMSKPIPRVPQRRRRQLRKPMQKT